MPRISWPPLVHAMQSDVSTAGAQDRGRTVEELERELAEAHRARGGDREILGSSAARRPTRSRCSTTIAEERRTTVRRPMLRIFRARRRVSAFVAHHGQSQPTGPRGHAIPVHAPIAVAGRAILDPQTLHVPICRQMRSEYPEVQRHRPELGYPSILVCLCCAMEANRRITVAR